MNTIKIYKIANKQKGQVEFGAQHGGKWLFKAGKWTLMTKVKGGQQVAEKIAEVIHKSMIRTAKKVVEDAGDRIDVIARRTIDRLLKIRTLADYKDEPEWWTNSCSDNPSVVMVSPAGREIPKGISAEDLAVETVSEQPEPAVELVQQ